MLLGCVAVFASCGGEQSKGKPDALVIMTEELDGLFNPFYSTTAPDGTIVGMTRGTGRAHIVRAALEAICYQSYDLYAAMVADNDGCAPIQMNVDGGASANSFMMQFQADIVGTTVHRPQCIETTALGAAYLAGLAVGYWKDKEEIRENWMLGASFTPQMEQEHREQLLKGWKKAVKCALAWE